ncbi:hemophore [Mycolicibacterium sp. XJ1819]
MRPTYKTLRRCRLAVFAASAVGGVAVAAMALPATPSMPLTPSATAAPDPCAASEVAKTIGSVATSMGSYLESDPKTNHALSAIAQQQGGPQSVVALKAYFDANPQVAKDMQKLQQPLTNLSGRCKLPVTLPQIMGLMQAAQQSGGVPTGLPGGLPTAQTVGVDGAIGAAQSAPASSLPQGAGRLPGPAIAGLP